MNEQNNVLASVPTTVTTFDLNRIRDSLGKALRTANQDRTVLLTLMHISHPEFVICAFV